MTPDSALRPQDIDALARLHVEAFPGFFLSSLGEHFLAEFYRAFLVDPTAIAVVARDSSGTPVGVAVGTTDPDHFFGRAVRRRWPAFAVAAARSAITRPSAIPRLLGAVTHRGDPSETVPGALLSSICVGPAQQGTGVGRTLEKAWTRAAAEHDAERAHLLTDRDDNRAANAFYRSSGWHLRDSFTTPEGRAMNRYEKKLDLGVAS